MRVRVLVLLAVVVLAVGVAGGFGLAMAFGAVQVGPVGAGLAVTAGLGAIGFGCHLDRRSMASFYPRRAFEELPGRAVLERPRRLELEPPRRAIGGRGVRSS